MHAFALVSHRLESSTCLIPCVAWRAALKSQSFDFPAFLFTLATFSRASVDQGSSISPAHPVNMSYAPTAAGTPGATSTKTRQLAHLAQQLHVLAQRTEQLEQLTAVTAEQASYMRLLAGHHAAWSVPRRPLARLQQRARC